MITRKYNVELIECPNDIQGAYEKAEIGARTCYKSEDVIKYDENGRSITAKPFVEKLVNVSKHGSIAEHGQVTLKIPFNRFKAEWNLEKYIQNKFSKVTEFNNYAYVTTNLRVLYENDWLDDIKKYWSDITEYHVPRIMFRISSQCAISREAHRHRVHSPSEQSTRYCNYSKGKFGGEVSINVPLFAEDCKQLKQYNSSKTKENFLVNYCQSIANDYTNPYMFKDKFDYWMFANLAAEYAYLGMLKCGAVPDEARTVLPLDTHTEFVHSAYIWDWFNFLKLRTSPNAHKDIRVIANIIKDTLIEKGYFTSEEFDEYDDGWDLFSHRMGHIFVYF